MWLFGLRGDVSLEQAMLVPLRSLSGSCRVILCV